MIPNGKTNTAAGSTHAGWSWKLRAYISNLMQEAENKQEVGPPQCPTSFSKLGAKCTNA